MSADNSSSVRERYIKEIRLIGVWGSTTALVETIITWKSDGHDEGTFSTQGVDSDQLAAAVIATEKMLNAVAPRAKRRARATSRRKA